VTRGQRGSGGRWDTIGVHVLPAGPCLANGALDPALGGRGRLLLEQRGVSRLGFGRIVASEIEAPPMLVNLV
jgi:hypothetical protein